MTLEQGVYDLLNIYNGARTSRDTQVSQEQIKFWIKQKRETYLKQKIDKGEMLESFYVQNLGCIPVSPVDRSTCCSEDIGCVFLRSDVPIPRMLQLSRFGSIDRAAKRWQLVDYVRVPLEKYAPKFSRKGIKGYFTDFDQYLYLYYDPEYFSEGKFLTQVNLMGVLADPTEAKDFNDCQSGSACYSDSMEYPMTLKLWNDIKRDILVNELRLTTLTQEDTTNNSISDPNTQQLRQANVQKLQ